MSQPTFNIITDPTVLKRREERAEEYGTWECAEGPGISFDGARAFNPGEPVPKSTVERFGLDKLGAVVPAGTAAKKAEEDARPQDEVDAEVRDALLSEHDSAGTAEGQQAEERTTTKRTSKKAGAAGEGE